MADKIINQMIKLHIIDDEEKEIYQFGIDGLILKFLHYSSYLLIAALFKEMVRFFIFFVAFLVLRKSAGGYHAKSKTGCYLVSCLTVITSILSMKTFSAFGSNTLAIIVLAILVPVADICICLIAPLGNRNRDLDEAEIRYFRKRTLMFLILENSCILLLGVMGFERYAIGIVLAIICQAILLLLEKTRKKEKQMVAIIAILFFGFFPISANAKEIETSQRTEIVIVLDCSQSMENIDEQYKTLDFIKEISAIVPRNYAIGVVAYDEEICFELPVGSNYEEIDSKLEEVEYKHYGNAGTGLSEAVDLFGNEATEKKILMISDGEIMMKTDEQTAESIEEFEQAVERAQNENITIDIVALGQRIEGDNTIYSAAEDTNGRIYELTDGSGLAEFVEKKLLKEWDIKESRVGTLSGTNGDLVVKLPDCYMNKAKIFLLGKQQNENLTVNCKADEINTYKGEGYTVIEIIQPESEEVEIQMSAEQAMDINAYLTAEYELILSSGHTYIPETGITNIWVGIENLDGENLLEGHLNDNSLKVYFNEEERKYTIEDGKITLEETIQQDITVNIKMKLDDLYGNYYGENEVAEQIIIPEPEEEPEQIDWFFWGVILLFVISLMVIFLLAKRKEKYKPMRKRVIDDNKTLPRERGSAGNDFYGKIQIYVIHNKNNIDYPPESINLFARCNRELITLEWLLDACNLPLDLRGAEKIIMRPGADKSLIIKNNSKAAALMGRELMLKGRSYHLYFHEKVTFIFDQEDTEIEVHYKDLKPNER